MLLRYTSSGSPQFREKLGNNIFQVTGIKKFSIFLGRFFLIFCQSEEILFFFLFCFVLFFLVAAYRFWLEEFLLMTTTVYIIVT